MKMERIVIKKGKTINEEETGGIANVVNRTSLVIMVHPS